MRALLMWGTSSLACALSVGQTCVDPWLASPAFPHSEGGVTAAVAWDPDGVGPLPETLVIAGFASIPTSPACQKVAVWDGVIWQPLGNPAVVPQPLAVVSGQLHGGDMRWNGSSWQKLGAGLSWVAALTEWNGSPIAVGAATLAQPTTSIYRWNGGAWEELGTTDMARGSAAALTVFGGELVAAGSWTTIGGQTIRGVARFDGASWKPVGAGIASGALFAATVTGGNLYVGGAFSLSSPAAACAVAKWDGAAWTKYGPTGLTPRGLSSVGTTPVLLAPSCGDGCSTTLDTVYTLQSGVWKAIATDGPTGDVQAIAKWGDRIAAVGKFTCVGAGPQLGNLVDVAVFGSQRWGALTAGLNGSTTATLKLGEALVIGGGFTQAPDGVGAARLAKWDGNTFSPLGDGFNGGVTSLAVWSNQLLAGGAFTKSGSGSVPYAAVWNGTTWQAIGNGGFDGAVNYLACASDRVYAAGSFSHAGGLLVSGMAQFVGGAWYSIGGRLSGGSAIGVHADDLYVAGPVSTSSGTMSGIARYSSGAWSSIAPELSGAVKQLFSDNESLWISGSFKITISGPTNTVARWNGSVWQGFAIGAGSGRLLMHDGALHLADLGGIWRWNGSSWSFVAARTGSTGDVISTACSFGNEIIVGGSRLRDLAGTFVLDPLFQRWSALGVPGFLRQPAPVTIDPGQLATLSVSVMSGYGAYGGPHFQWRRNGEPLADGVSPAGGVVSGATSSLLTIAMAGIGDSGFYDCVVSTDCGSTASESARLLVGPPCDADFNDDGLVDDSDFQVFAIAYNILDCADPSMGVGCPADLNNDAMVDDADFSLFVPAYSELICP